MREVPLRILQILNQTWSEEWIFANEVVPITQIVSVMETLISNADSDIPVLAIQIVHMMYMSRSCYSMHSRGSKPCLGKKGHKSPRHLRAGVWRLSGEGTRLFGDFRSLILRTRLFIATETTAALPVSQEYQTIGFCLPSGLLLEAVVSL